MTPERVLDFWFGADFADRPLQKQRNWFEKNPDFDAAVILQFKDLLEGGAAQAWDLARPAASLAFVLLHDQFPRHVYRGTGRSFSYDARALEAARKGVAAGSDRKLHWIERTFYYLPFEHSESLGDQARSVELFRGLAGETPPEFRAFTRDALDYAERHRAIVERFGRFPHRNALLDRTTTAEEGEFLKQPGSSF